MPKDEQTMFDEVCSAHFDEIKAGLAEGKAERKEISDRLFKTNGKRALITVIEDNTKANQRLEKKVDDHVDAEPAPAEQQKTVKQLSLTKEGLTIKGVSGTDMIKILLLIAVIAYMVGRDHLPGFLLKMFPDEPATEAVTDG